VPGPSVIPSSIARTNADMPVAVMRRTRGNPLRYVRVTVRGGILRGSSKASLCSQ
jgi:hypothetical protein